MTIQRLTCPRGHTWEQAVEKPLPDDLAALCPTCQAGGQDTLDLRGQTAAVATTALVPGQVLPGFEIIEELSRGGMGVIYKARQTGLNRLVALKVIMPERLGHPDVLKRFQREVRAAALLSHPNIVTVHHTDLDGPRPYLVMEYVVGIDLSRLIARVGPLPVSEACSYVLQAAEGLQHAHEQGLVHRDIKPANLMVTPSPLDTTHSRSRPPRVKILDLGLARITTAEEQGGLLTLAGAFLGTPDYISPEQAEDSRKADIRSDLYSLGATLYFLLTGAVPFPSTNVLQKLRRQVTEAAPSPAALRPDVPAGVDGVVRKLLAPDPADRFQTPADFQEALEAVLRAPSAPPSPPRLVHPPPAAGYPTSGEIRNVLQLLAGDLDPSASTITRFKAHPGGVQSLGISADGKLLLSGGLDRALRVWEAERLRETLCISENVGPIVQVCLTAKARWAATCAARPAGEEPIVQLWDLAGSREPRRLRGLTRPVRCVAIAADNRHVAAGSDDGTIRVWSVDQPGSPSLCLAGHTDAVTSVTFLHASDILLSGSRDSTVRFWDVKTGQVKDTRKGHVGPIDALAFGGPSRRLALAGNRVRIRQPDGSATMLTGHQGAVACLVFSANGELVLTGGSDRTVRLWRAANGEEVCCLQGHTDTVRAVAFGPDGTVGYSGSADGTIRRWPLPS